MDARKILRGTTHSRSTTTVPSSLLGKLSHTLLVLQMLNKYGSSKRPITDRSSPEAVRTTEKCGWTVTPSVSTSSRQPLPSTLTLAPVSNKPVRCLPKVFTSAKESAESMRFTAATTSHRLDLLILKRSFAFWTLRETRRMPFS
nr:uncharacterized protein LOC108015843 [Drosophila suzukii]XP_036675156.1 uncharacterized protein LOC118878066 isoform X1 [Drosophila suzukii]